MAKSKDDLLRMYKNQLIELADKNGISVKPYWTKEKIIDVLMEKEKVFSEKKESIAKDFKKRWMELQKAPEDVRKVLKRPDRKEFVDKTERLEALIKKEKLDKVKLKEFKRKKHEKKLLRELDLATAELDRDMMEKFKNDRVDVSEFEKIQKQTIPSRLSPSRTQTLGPKMGKIEPKVDLGKKVPLSSIGMKSPPSRMVSEKRKGKKGAGLINGNGLTNGKGLINGLMSHGLINGKGLVNGSTQGFVNGQQQGFINGKGIVPSKVRRGATNGVGIVNGMYKKALINGNGLTNGNGITNGIGISTPFFKEMGAAPNKIVRRLARINIIQNRLRRERLAIILVIIALIFAPILFFMSDIEVKEGLKIDAEFSDWSEIETFKDNEFDQIKNQNINIIEYSVTGDDKELFFYLKTKQDVFEGYSQENAYADEILNIFIDIDSDSSTGYTIDEFGADYRLELTGFDNKINTKSVYRFVPESYKYDWNNWEYIKSFDAEHSKTELEANVKFENNGNLDVENSHVIFVFKDYEENTDQSDAIISPGKPAIWIDECLISPPTVPYNQTKVPFLKLTLNTFGINEIKVISLEFIVLGSINHLLINNLNMTLSIDQDKSNDYSIDVDKIITSALSHRIDIDHYGNNKSHIKFNFSQELTILKDQPLEILLLCDIPKDLPRFTTLGFKLNPKIRNPEYTLTITSSLTMGCDSPSTYIGGVPDRIMIDGAFADWDPIHEYIDSDEIIMDNDNVNINSYKIHQENEDLSFFFNVKGRLFGGTSVAITPNLKSKHIERIDSDVDGVPDELDPNPYLNEDSDFDGWSDDFEDVISKTNKSNSDTDSDGYIDSQDLAPLDPNIPPIPQKITMMDGNDTAIIFIDSDQDKRTGYSTPELKIGAEYVIRIRGKYGYIINSSFYEFYGTDRYNLQNLSFIKQIEIGTDSHRLETQISLYELGIFVTQGVDVIFLIHDWDRRNSDTSDSVLASDLGIKPTPRQVTILNQISKPRNNQWYINFLTSGTGIITLGNHSFPNYVSFKGLYYLNPSDQMYYHVPVGLDIANQTLRADWRYRIGLVIFEPRTDEEHIIEIIFGNKEFAMMNPFNESRAELLRQINSGELDIHENSGNSIFGGTRGRPEETKTLYLLDNGTADMMNTSQGSGVNQYVRINNNENNSWLQAPPLAGDFSLTGSISVMLYIDPERATGFFSQEWPDVTVTLSYGSTSIGSDTVSDIQQENWYTFVIWPSVSSIPENNAVDLEVSVTSAAAGFFGSAGWADIYYNSSTNNSRMVIQTDTYIKVNWIKTFNDSGSETIVFDEGTNITIRANITDPLGVYDIKYANVTMLMPDKSTNPGLNDVEMTVIDSEDSIAPYFWRVYEYKYEIPETFFNGWYTLWVNATESNGVKDAKEFYFIIPPVYGVSIYPDITRYVSADSIQNYTFTLKNIGNSSDDYEISVSASSQGWGSNLYFNDVLVAYDSDGDGTWDWIFSNYDTTNDGNPDINLTPLEETNLTLQKIIPSGIKSKTDITKVFATSYHNNSINDSAIAKSVVSLSKKIKNLYLHENGLNDLMDTFIGTGPSSTFVRIMDDDSHIWIQSPEFASDFNIEGNISVYLNIAPTSGTGWFTEGAPDVEVTLSYGSTTIGSEKITGLTTSQLYTFTIVPSVQTIPEGNAITLQVDVDSASRGFFGADGYIDLYYDSSTYDSKIDIPTDTYIDVEWLKTFNLTTDTEESEFYGNEYVEIRANITDPLGVNDTSAFIYVTSPGGSYGDLVNNQPMMNYTRDPTSPFFWQIYNYSYKLPLKPINGTYQINVIGRETNNVTVNASTTFIVYGTNVTIIPEYYSQVLPGTNVSYLHTITNNGAFDDSFEISITSVQNWNISIYNDSNNNGVLDPTDQLMAFDSNGDGTWDWVNTSNFDSDNDGSPDTGDLPPGGKFKIIVEVHVPISAGLVTEKTKIIVTSNLNAQTTDSAVDTTVVVPEFIDLIIPIMLLITIGIIMNSSDKKKKNH